MSFFLTPEEIARLQWTYPSAGEILLFLIGISFFLFLNAFFVANEFASARVRESQLAENEEDTKTQAKRRSTARHIVRHLDTYLSANQVGITIASLALGAMGEPFIASLIESPLRYFLHLSDVVVHVIAYTLAYALFTFAHVVLGELVPKSLAIRHPLEISLLTSVWMMRFAKSTKWIIHLFNNTANGIAHRVFGVDPHYEPNPTHSAEEIALIVEQSGRSNEVTETEAEISMNALELNDRSVRDIMVPRSKVEVIDINQPFEHNLQQVLRSRHSRFALVSGHLDHVKGWVHVKDILQLLHANNHDILSERRELKVVPEMMKLDTLLDFFSKEHTHFALVVDEYGEAQGMVYLDDVLEEIVGNDIQDEFEMEATRNFFPVGKGQYIASGTIPLFDLEEELPDIGGIECDGGISTLSGYITDKLGHMPVCDEQVRLKQYLITVTGTDGRRVTQTRIEYAPLHSDEDEEDEELPALA